MLLNAFSYLVIHARAKQLLHLGQEVARFSIIAFCGLGLVLLRLLRVTTVKIELGKSWPERNWLARRRENVFTT